jgi:hypothetical protein
MQHPKIKVVEEAISIEPQHEFPFAVEGISGPSEYALPYVFKYRTVNYILFTVII